MQEWQTAFTRIGANTTYTITFPDITLIHEICFNCETNTVATSTTCEFIFNAGSGNKVSWIDSLYTTRNYNIFRVTAGTPQFTTFKVKMYVYDMSVITGNTFTWAINLFFNVRKRKNRRYSK